MITTSKLSSDLPVNLPIYVVCAECKVWCGCSVPSSGVESWLVFRFVYQVQPLVILPVFLSCLCGHIPSSVNDCWSRQQGRALRDSALSFGESMGSPWISFFFRFRTWNLESSMCVVVWIASMLFLTKVRIHPLLPPIMSDRNHWYPLLGCNR